MTQDQRLFGVLQLAIAHVQIRAAHSASANSNQQLPEAKAWARDSLFQQGLARCLQHHGAH